MDDAAHRLLDALSGPVLVAARGAARRRGGRMRAFTCVRKQPA